MLPVDYIYYKHEVNSPSEAEAPWKQCEITIITNYGKMSLLRKTLHCNSGRVLL